ncbi:DUF896 domain-containing protein [Acetobacterium paludosum]|uniref:UPF0291 protein GH810_05065 n=1 Tax=Acetobacterium paludosum TaxID=52693 RepID=A0A923KP16_9FIRM|nr:DUF896 domain-containing protein [Acetobacterium paludosum]MBC3887674.1 DUF896 domain-containing protein [Acetobacterium paludosum]
MITKEKIERINTLANKKKTMALTEEERIEQQSLRAEYLQAVRKNFRDQLDTIIIVDEPQCDKNKGGTKMEKDDNKRIYKNAQDAAMKQKGEAGGEDSSYYVAEEAGEKNKTNIHEVMAGPKDEAEKEESFKKESPQKSVSLKEEHSERIYENAQDAAMKQKGEAGGEDLSYHVAEEAGEKNKTNIHEVMAGSNDETNKAD